MGKIPKKNSKASSPRFECVMKLMRQAGEVGYRECLTFFSWRESEVGYRAKVLKHSVLCSIIHKTSTGKVFRKPFNLVVTGVGLSISETSFTSQVFPLKPEAQLQVSGSVHSPLMQGLVQAGTQVSLYS